MKFAPMNILKHGGAWLAACRTRIQSMFINGDRVTWQSDDELHPAATVKNVEELCACAVAADREEEDKNQKQMKTLVLVEPNGNPIVVIRVNRISDDYINTIRDMAQAKYNQRLIKTDIRYADGMADVVDIIEEINNP
jgi:hypothetical protein